MRTVPPWTMAGMSLPSSAPISMSSEVARGKWPGASDGRRELRPRRTAAASALPPPRPPPRGMRFVK